MGDLTNYISDLATKNQRATKKLPSFFFVPALSAGLDHKKSSPFSPCGFVPVDFVARSSENSECRSVLFHAKKVPGVY